MKIGMVLIGLTSLALVACTKESHQSSVVSSSMQEQSNTTLSSTGGLPMNLASGHLLEAVKKDNIMDVREILKQPSYPINETNERGESPLLIATQNNQIEIAKVLIVAGADVNQQDHIQDSPYLYAGAQGRNDILKFMLKNSLPNQHVYNRYGGNTLIPASEKGHLDTVKLLLEDGSVDIDHQNNFGYTALIEAVALTNGSTKFQQIVQVLLEYNADKSLRDNYGKTALDYAKELGYTEIQALLEH